MVGDFNCIRRVGERVGENTRDYDSVETRLFNLFIKDMDLMDVSVVGRSFS